MLQRQPASTSVERVTSDAVMLLVVVGDDGSSHLTAERDGVHAGSLSNEFTYFKKIQPRSKGREIVSNVLLGP